MPTSGRSRLRHRGSVRARVSRRRSRDATSASRCSDGNAVRVLLGVVARCGCSSRSIRIRSKRGRCVAVPSSSAWTSSVRRRGGGRASRRPAMSHPGVLFPSSASGRTNPERTCQRSVHQFGKDEDADPNGDSRVTFPAASFFPSFGGRDRERAVPESGCGVQEGGSARGGGAGRAGQGRVERLRHRRGGGEREEREEQRKDGEVDDRVAPAPTGKNSSRSAGHAH